MLITNFGLYNLKEKSTNHLNTAIKRRIDIDKIKAIIVSKIGTEFVVHVPSEYDYRYIISNSDTHPPTVASKSSTTYSRPTGKSKMTSSQSIIRMS